LSTVPDIEQRYRSIFGQLKGEHIAAVNELKKKAASLKAVSDRLTETQRAHRELQSQVQRARKEASCPCEDAAFHRTIGEDVRKRATDQSDVTVKDANATVQHWQIKLHEKTNENPMRQRLFGTQKGKSQL
jgi:hypothetical protein